MNRHPYLAAALSALLLLPLAGCREGDLERIWNNERIYALAKKNAQRLAEEYIEEKYGLAAETLGYDVDGSDVFMAYRASPAVYVAMTDGEQTFCVYLSLENESLRWDNYQRKAVAQALETCLLDRLGLPAPYASSLEFRLDRDRVSTGTAWINGEGYNASSMLDFYYDGQTAEELLPQMKRMEYIGRFLDGSLQEVELHPEEWPGENFDLEVKLERYRDQESCDYYASRGLNPYESVHHYERPALLESAGLSLEVEDGQAEREETYTVYDRVETCGVGLVAWAENALPPDWAEGLAFPQETLEWTDRDRRYEAVTPLFCWTAPEEGAEENVSLLCSLPPEFFQENGELLYCGRYDPETGEMTVDRSLPLRPGKPGTFTDGSVLIRQDFGISPGTWYAVLRPQEQEETPK